MNSENIFENIENVLDELIQNAAELNETTYEEKEAIDQLQKKQNALLDTLLELNHQINDELKYEMFKKDRNLYPALQERVKNFSTLNRSSLREPKDRWIKPSRVHRNKRASMF